MLEWIGVHKSYGANRVLCGVDLAVRPGQVLGLVGSNGAGKTTLISIAVGLTRADSGRVVVQDVGGWVDVARDPRRAARLLGVAPQGLGVYPMLTVEQNLRALGEIAGLRRSESRRRAREVAEAVGLADRMDASAGTLSGGQARRLHTAMALVHRPRVLFLDEPTVGADVAARRAILDTVRALATDGTAIVYTTHYLTELVDLRADVAILHTGRVVLESTVDRMLLEHARPTVAIVTDGRHPELPGWHQDQEWSPDVWGSPQRPATQRWVPDDRTLDAGDPTAVVTTALARLTTGTALRAIEITPATLDSAYLAVTGQALAHTTKDTPDAVLA